MNIQDIVKQNKASQGKEELTELLTLLKYRNFKVILELGVHRGYSLVNWRRAFNPEVLIGVDNDLHDFDKDITDIANALLINTDSHDKDTLKNVKDHLNGRKVDFLFIDGDHVYKGVKKDFQMYSKLVKNGGVIVFHDAALENHPGVKVKEYWDEIKDNYVSTTIDNGYSGYGVILNYE